MIVPRYYEDLSILHENTMPNRSYYIPASKRMDNLVDDRAASDRFQLLSGDWKFKFYDSIYDLKDAFFTADYDVSDFDTIPVPSNWQMHGYDLHHYINSRYPFPADPPYVPHDNPCGTYVTKFQYQKDLSAPLTFLNFEGVDSCFYVWLNGKYVGYSQVAHSTSEFDVTDHLCDGENTLAVLVLKWCDGSYLECQDKFRWSGIFRDVYLLNRPSNMLWDYFITSKLGQGSAAVTVRTKTLPEDAFVRVSLYDPCGNLIATGKAEEYDDDHFSQAVSLNVADPMLWNAEQPNLYTVVLETEGETIVDYVGLREVCVKDSVVYLNGAPIKFRGVNRHESDPVKGYVIDLEQTKRELKLLKEYNFNGIRTSHYPSHPLFYYLCDRYGFYVIDEADIEAHGAEHCWHDGKLSNNKKWNVMVADDPDFIGSIVDRVQRMVQRDKNRPSAVIWSMGNESAYGCGFELALAWTKNFDPSRLTHYESAQYINDDRKYDYSNLDLWSEMYASLEFMDEYLAKNPDKPFIQCEYSHAMGNGPGDLEDYFQKFESDPRFCGGFVWEFLDHAVFKGYAENGKAMYYYGGDHNELVHDGNFCMDGLVYPDRRPHTGIMEFKNVHRPARASYDQTSGIVTLRNKLAFLDLKDYLTVSYELTCDGVVTSAGEAGELPAILPGCEGTIALRLNIPEKGNCYLKLTYNLKEATELLPQGHSLGFDEFKLENGDGRNQEALQLLATNAEGKLNVSEDDEWITVAGNDFTYVYSKRSGLWESMVINGKKLLEKPMELNIWRAPTDNDRQIKGPWMLAKHHVAYARAYESFVLEEDGIVRIENTMSVGAMTTRPVVRMTSAWTVYPTGVLEWKADAGIDQNYKMIPRFGIRLFLPKEMEQVCYFGMGPVESYIDKCRASYHGRFETTVTDLHEDYLRPQENGSHYDCDFLRLTGSGMTLTCGGENTFCFNASHYTQEELTQKAHNFELEESGYTVLCLDYAQNGIGSNSCGPALSKKYALRDEQFAFTIRLVPEHF